MTVRRSDDALSWREWLRWLLMRDQVGATTSDDLIIWVPAAGAQ
jgi:hypothetical protein